LNVRWILVAAALIASGCGADTPPLSNTYPSAETLSVAVLQALERRDGARLREIALNEQEFRDHVWPELPAARPERNLPFSYVWGDLRQKSELALDAMLSRHGGRRYTLIATHFAGETTRYRSYAVYRETVLRVRDENGAMLDLRLFGSSLQKDRIWKVFSYVVDD
jgi:hypothetical protein